MAKAKEKKKKKGKGKGDKPETNPADVFIDRYDELFTDDPIEVHNRIIFYFEDCQDTREVPTLVGLARSVGLTRESLRKLEGVTEDPTMLAVLQQGRQRIEAMLEARLVGSAAAGVMFNLRSNFNWKDETKLSVSGPGGGPITTASVDPSTLSDDTLKELVAMRRALTDAKSK